MAIDYTLKAGDKAPAFSLPDQNGTVIDSETLAGQKYILYFYPKDSTPGCTLEAQGFRDAHEKFAALGYRIFGVSRDSQKSHANFCQKQSLNFTLLSDKEEALCLAYDVIHELPYCGRLCRKLQRSTFVVDEKGIVTHALRDVKAKVHVEELLALLQKA